MKLALMPVALRIAAWIAAFLAIVGGGWLLFAPAPVDMETAVIERGPMEVTVDQQGEVRVHDRYIVSAPVAGRLQRVELHDGDVVKAGQIVAVIEPAPLDPRQREETLARVDAARASVREAGQNIEHARADLTQAQRDRERTEKLIADKFVSPEALDKVRTAEITARAALEGARSRERASRAELAAAEAALMAIDPARKGRLVQVAAPVSGKVLRVVQKSESVIAGSAPILVIGDPTKFEIVADVLSTDAVKIKAGAAARIVEWGGDRAIPARVETVEPYAFTKVSALGVEEKRVNVIMVPTEGLGPLGDGYRIEARIVVWSGDNVLKAPTSALYRTSEGGNGGGWSVFVVENGRAHIRKVEVGQRNPRETEILGGLAAGERVVRYPSNELMDGARVRIR